MEVAARTPIALGNLRPGHLALTGIARGKSNCRCSQGGVPRHGAQPKPSAASSARHGIVVPADSPPRDDHLGNRLRAHEPSVALGRVAATRCYASNQLPLGQFRCRRCPGVRGCLTPPSARATTRILGPRQAMVSRVRILCRDLSALFDRIALSRPSSPVEHRSPIGTSAVQAIKVSMKYHSIWRRSLTVTIPTVFLILLYRIATPDIHPALDIPLSAVAVLVAVVSLLMLMNIITSKSIIRQIKGDRLLELFESADDTVRRAMCDDLERLYNSNRTHLAKYDRIGLIVEPWFCCILPNSTEIQNALEDTLEAWILSMNPAFRKYVQNCIDELAVDEADTTEEKTNAQL